MTDSMNEVGWNDTSVASADPSQRGRKVERFTGKQGKSHRITVLTERPIRTFTHYKRGYGYFSCLKADGLECVACAANEKPSEKFACNILVYPDGTSPVAPWDASQLKIMLWQPGPKVFGDIRGIYNNWGPLQGYDIEVTCTNEKYQHLNVTPTPKLLWKEHPQAAQIAEMIERDQYDLKKLVGGRKETVEEVRQIWTTNVTRDQLREQRDKQGPAQTATPYAPPVSGMPPAPFGNAAAPARTDFNGLLRGTMTR